MEVSDGVYDGIGGGATHQASLQPRAVNDLVIHSKLATSIIDDQNTNTTTAVGKGIVKSRPQATLINDWEALLYIAGLGHGNDAAIIADIEDTVLFEYRAQHILDDD